MTDPQLTNNNNNNNNNNNSTSNNNNNNDGEPKYLHKKFKKMATTEASSPVETIKRETPTPTTTSSNEIVEGSSESPKKIEIFKDAVKESSRTDGSPESEGEPTESRKTGYVCPYCKLSCAKPSVLQKHIRAHTNERPYPCVPCGFAFKTKSNLYKHCRSRAHALKMEGGDASKVSEDSDISLSDSASNGTGTPPPALPPPAPPPSASTPSSVSCSKTIKTGKIYKPKFHTALQCVNNETVETSSSNSSNSSISTVSASSAKPNAEQLQEHIDKIITDNRAIVEAIDPRLHKLMARQQSLVETKPSEQPLNLSSIESSSSTRKRCYSDSFAQENRERVKISEGSIIKDLLLKTRASTVKIENSSSSENDTHTCELCRISYTSADNLEAHRRYYCGKGTFPRKAEFQLDLEKRDDYESSKTSDYYGTIQPLPSPGPLLGNTRLVDAYASPQPPPMKKERLDCVPTAMMTSTTTPPTPTSLRTLEELSKYPRPNLLQMFGGQVRILNNSGGTKTMRIEPRQTNSPSSETRGMQNDDDDDGKPSEGTETTASIVVRSGLHSGGTMVHKPPGPTSAGSMTPNNSISLPCNAPKILGPIIPNISTPNLAPTMSCYNYLESRMNPLTSITAYNPLTLPQAGIASIIHGGKVIPYVPGMPGPHTLSVSQNIDVTSNSSSPSCSSYKMMQGLSGLCVVNQPLDLASPIGTTLTPSVLTVVPNSNGPHSISTIHGQVLDLASPSSSEVRSITSPKAAPSIVDEKYRRASSLFVEPSKNELERRLNNSVAGKYKITNVESLKTESALTSQNGSDNVNSQAKRFSPKIVNEQSRKRVANWSIADLENPGKMSSPPLLAKIEDNDRTDCNALSNSEKIRNDLPAVIIVNVDSSEKQADLMGSVEKIEIEEMTGEHETTTKFLRPTSLPLKPGTFTPKRHHGITPTANTLPLISPETPRPKKSYGQLYLNGHAYTYLGLKCSTRVFYCTLNRPQPMYVDQRQHGLSMYSNWKICKESPPDIDMAHYDSRNRPPDYTVAWKKQEDIMTHSSQRPTTPTSPDSGLESDTQEKTRRVKIFDGGFESNEDYTYVRGRGRGRYVCEECGIRCKKPSMLKKHIRTHTDVRPYTCKHCSFSFKTKGNLTKHMKSKAHYKKCVELGVMPVPTSVCDENIDKEAIARLVAGGGNADDTSDEEDESEVDESDESGSEEQEAAQSLLSLSRRNSNRLPGLLPAGRPTTYPYALTFATTSATTTSIVSTQAGTTASMSVTSSTVITSESSNRYYFPSSRATSNEECRDSVIRSSRNDDLDQLRLEESSETINRSSSQPMDLTTKQQTSTIVERIATTEILTNVSEAPQIIMQTIVQTMDRLPLTGREWKSDVSAATATDGQMLQAYLTERHVMDSKMKQQYRVGDGKFDKLVATSPYVRQLEFTSCSRNSDSCGGTSTVTYTNPSRLRHTLENRVKPTTKQQTSDEIKMEIRDKIYQNNGIIERRPFDIDSLNIEQSSSSSSSSSPSSLLSSSSSSYGRSIVERENTLENRSFLPALSNLEHHSILPNKNIERFGGPEISAAGRVTPSFLDRQSPRNFNVETENRSGLTVLRDTLPKSEIDRGSMLNAIRMINEIERTSRESTLESRITKSPRIHENGTTSLNSRATSRSETRPLSQDYRMGNSVVHRENNSSSQEFKLPTSQEIRPPSREFKSPHPDLVGPLSSATSVLDTRRNNISNNAPPSPVREIRAINDYKNEHRSQDFGRTNFENLNHHHHHHQQHHHQETNKLHELSRIQRQPEAKRQDMEITKQSLKESMKQHTVARKMVVGGPGFRSPSPPGGNVKPQAEFLQPSSGPAPNYVSVTEDGRSVCGICNKVFSKPSQLRLHINIHYFERPFRCESCAVSFRTKGHLTKHERSVSHHNKVSMTSTFGAATTSNPRPFKCTDCKIAFRIHGHLAKHLRSKMHIMKLECLGKLPFGTYAEMERSGVNLNDIDTTDCDNSLTSLQILAQKLYEKDPSKMGQWDAEMIPHQGAASGGETSSDEGEPIPSHTLHQYPPPSQHVNPDNSRTYHMPMLTSDETKVINDVRHVNSRFCQQRGVDYPRKERARSDSHDEMRNDDISHPYKCQMCTISVRSVNELQMHCFVEHSNHDETKTKVALEQAQNREKDCALKRLSDEIDRGGRKSEDS